MKNFINGISGEIGYIAVKISDGTKTTTGAVYVNIQRTSDDLYWTGTIWGAQTNLLMTHKNNGLWIYNWTPNIVGDVRITCWASTDLTVPFGTVINIKPAEFVFDDQWTDIKAGYIDAAISSIGAGTGTNTVTITLTKTGGIIKIPAAAVSVKDITGVTLLATGTTDANGQVQFMLNNGTYSVYKQKLGSDSFTNPETLTVVGNTSASYIGTPISVSASTQPNTSRMFIWARNPDGTLMTTLVGNVRITALPYKFSGAAHKGDEISFIKHADGYWYVDVVYGATIIIYIPAIGINITVIAPSLPTKDISDFIT